MRIKTTVTETLAFSDVAMEFINFKAAEQVAPRTLNDYIKTFKKFSDFGCNTMELEILNNDLVEFFKSIPDTSPAVYNRPFSNLSSFFNWCVKQDILECNPLSKLGLHKKRDDGNIHSASIDDIKALLDTCDRKTFTGLRNYTMILLMLDTGIRTSEITRLVNSDYDAAAGTIIVTKDKAKTRRERICYLSDNVISALNKYLRIKPAEIEFIFPSRDANQLSTNELAREFRKLSDKAEVKVTPYQLRHSFATYFIENGGNVFVLQNLMGHSEIRMTLRYTDISENQKKTAHARNTPTNLLLAHKRL